MRKLVITFMLALACVCAHAQHTVYCEILQFSPGGFKSSISVDFGNNGTESILDENGEKIKFNSSIDALAYFEKLGWSVASVYSVNHNSGLASVPVVHYLMQKKVTSYDEKMDGIKTKSTQQKKEKTSLFGS